MKTLAPFLRTLLALAVLVAAGPAAARAQTGILSETGCRCVDKDGKEIENCRCFRTFEPGQFSFNFAPFGSTRARLGITVSPTAGDDDARGARVESVLEDGPADRAGLQEGDIITHIDGHSLLDPLDDEEAEEGLDLDGSLTAQRLLQIARNLEPGEEVEIRYLRNGEARTTTLEAEDLAGWAGNLRLLGEGSDLRLDLQNLRGELEGIREPGVLFRPFENVEPRVWNADPEGRDLGIVYSGWLGAGDYFNTCPESGQEENLVFLGTGCIGGLRMEKMNPRLGEYFGTTTGVLVADVHPDSKLGLEAGDVVLRVGDRNVTDPDHLRRILRSYEPDESITLHVMRQKREIAVTGTLER